ncbi:MAG: hypothetical protein JWP03_1780 [Phycisphaerales bacterium]|nr:hypothetical protein [Phycisphaerales bacterium]
MHIDVRESNHPVAQFPKNFRSPRVGVFIANVRFAVNFHDESSFGTVEIRDIPVNPNLASELVSIQSAISEAIP